MSDDNSHNAELKSMIERMEGVVLDQRNSVESMAVKFDTLSDKLDKVLDVLLGNVSPSRNTTPSAVVHQEDSPSGNEAQVSTKDLAKLAQDNHRSFD